MVDRSDEMPCVDWLFCEGNFLPSSDDPVAIRMVSDKSMRRRSRDDGVVGGERSPYAGVVSLMAVFAGAAATTIASLTAFVAAYVYIEAVRNSRRVLHTYVTKLRLWLTYYDNYATGSTTTDNFANQSIVPVKSG